VISIPRKPTDSVQEFRITLGDYERKKLEEILTTQKSNVVIDGVTATLGAAGTAVGGLGVWGLALAALIWAGWDLDDSIDKWSSKLTDYLSTTGFTNYTADEYGRQALKISAQLDEAMLAFQSIQTEMRETGFNPTLQRRAMLLQTKVADLVKQRERLEAIIAAIADGSRDVAGWVFSYNEDEYQQRAVQNEWARWYRATYGEDPPEYDWDIGVTDF
jgi:hypothetical protein